MWLFFWDAAKLIEDNVILSGLAFKIYYTGPKQWLYSTNYSPLLRQDPSGCPIQCLMNFVLFQPGWWELALFPALSGCWVLFPVILLGDPTQLPLLVSWLAWRFEGRTSCRSLELSLRLSPLCCSDFERAAAFRLSAVSSAQGLFWPPLASWPGNSQGGELRQSRAHVICLLSLRCDWHSLSDGQCLETHLKKYIVWFLCGFRQEGKSAPWNRSLEQCFCLFCFVQNTVF